MSLPRDLTGDELVQLLSRLGYRVTRQSGSHMRLTTQEEGQHHVTIPRHKPLRVGTLAGILRDVARSPGSEVEAGGPLCPLDPICAQLARK